MPLAACTRRNIGGQVAADRALSPNEVCLVVGRTPDLRPARGARDGRHEPSKGRRTRRSTTSDVSFGDPLFDLLCRAPAGDYLVAEVKSITQRTKSGSCASHSGSCFDTETRSHGESTSQWRGSS